MAKNQGRRYQQLMSPALKFYNIYIGIIKNFTYNSTFLPPSTNSPFTT